MKTSFLSRAVTLKTKILKRPRLLAFIGIGFLIGFLGNSFFLLIKYHRSLNNIYETILPIQKSITLITAHSNALNFELQTALFFEKPNPESIEIYQLEKSRLKKNIKLFTTVSKNSNILGTSSSVDRNLLFKTENKVIQLIEDNKIVEARDLYYGKEYTNLNYEYSRNLIEVKKHISSKILIFKLQQETNFRFVILGTVFAFFITLIVWTIFVIAFKRVKDERIETQDLLEKEKLNSINAYKMASLGEMAGGIAHEINNPLTIIKGSSDIIVKNIRDGNLNPKLIEKYSEKISKTTDRVSKVIISLKNFSRDGSDDPFENYSVSKLIEGSLDLCSEKFKVNGIDFINDKVDPNLKIDCRVIQIEQVLVNLFNNAFDAVSTQEEKWVKVFVEEDDVEIKICVQDSGIGVSKEVIEKIMQPFFTTKELGKGTGLGLSISKGIIESHSGAINIEDSYGFTTFSLSFPKFSGT